MTFLNGASFEIRSGESVPGYLEHQATDDDGDETVLFYIVTYGGVD